MDLWDLCAEVGEHEGIAPQPGGGIDDGGIGALFQADGFGQWLPSAAAKFASMGEFAVQGPVLWLAGLGAGLVLALNFVLLWQMAGFAVPGLSS